MAMRLERRGPTGQGYPQESNRAHLRAAIAALQYRQWWAEGWTAITIATDSEYLMEGITNWIEIWQQNGWLTSRETGDNYNGDAVANRDLWELLLWEIMELSHMGLEVRFWLILHELNAEAHAEARMAAEMLKEEEFFCRLEKCGLEGIRQSQDEACAPPSTYFRSSSILARPLSRGAELRLLARRVASSSSCPMEAYLLIFPPWSWPT